MTYVPLALLLHMDLWQVVVSATWMLCEASKWRPGRHALPHSQKDLTKDRARTRQHDLLACRAMSTLPLLPMHGRVFRRPCAKAGQCFGHVLKVAKLAIYLMGGDGLGRSERETEANRWLPRQS